jgi:hypothetical protein
MILYTSVPSFFISDTGCSLTHWLVNICYPGLTLPYLIRSVRLHLVFKYYGIGGARDPAVLDNVTSPLHGAARFASRSVTPAPGTPLRTPRGSISHFPFGNDVTRSSGIPTGSAPGSLIPSRSIDFFGVRANGAEPEWTIGSLQGAPAGPSSLLIAATAPSALRAATTGGTTTSAAVKIGRRNHDDGALTSDSWSQSASPYLLPSRSTDEFSAIAGTSPLDAKAPLLVMTSFIDSYPQYVCVVFSNRADQ